MKALILILALLLCVGIVAAQKLTEPQHDKLLAAYEKAVIAQNNYQAAQAKLQETVDAYNAIVEQVKKEGKMPPGTSFTIDLSAKAGQEITVQTPPVQDKSKSDEKKK